MASQFHGTRILLVEDNAPLLRSLSFLLTVLGCEVASASDGEAALESLRTYPPDLVISDIDMPGLNGYELLQRTRSHPATASIPVILTSDRYSLDDLMYALDLGADDYLPKPYDIHDVIDAIERTLPPQHLRYEQKRAV
jgi:CheY-like chemotaxis protein